MTPAVAHSELRSMSREVPDVLIRFGRALDAAGRGPAVDGWPYFLERSEKWSSEYVAWIDAGQPDDVAIFAPLLDELERVTP